MRLSNIGPEAKEITEEGKIGEAAVTTGTNAGMNGRERPRSLQEDGKLRFRLVGASIVRNIKQIGDFGVIKLDPQRNLHVLLLYRKLKNNQQNRSQILLKFLKQTVSMNRWKLTRKNHHL